MPTGPCLVALEGSWLLDMVFQLPTLSLPCPQALLLTPAGPGPDLDALEDG